MTLVETAIAGGKQLRDLTLDDYNRASPHFEQDILNITVESAIAKRDIVGGTAPNRVRDAIADARVRLQAESS